MSAAAARCEGAELPRDMYSVLRSHETSAAIGGVPPPWRPWRPKPSALPAGSSRSAWSFGSSSGGFCGSGFSAVKSQKKPWETRQSVCWGRGILEQVRAYRGCPRRLPRGPPIYRDRGACRTRRRLPWGAVPHSWRRRETRVACSVLGWLGCRGVLVDMVGLVGGSGSGPWPRDRVCCVRVSINVGGE